MGAATPAGLDPDIRIEDCLTEEDLCVVEYFIGTVRAIAIIPKTEWNSWTDAQREKLKAKIVPT